MSLVDLDDLVLRCRDDAVRSALREAVACYRAGAFRSCVVATWNAVVFDFLHKLRELELSGDLQAKSKLAEFEVIRLGGEAKLKDALEFERTALDEAVRKFELLTLAEQIDLERLRLDRSRCAHPSMQSADTWYEPSAELARAHMRNAVELMLSREPVQGKAAFDRVIAETKSPYFPKTAEKAQVHFTAGPLIRARKPLVRSVVLAITKSVLNDVLSVEERVQRIAALGAVLSMHRATVEEVFRNDVPKITGAVSDENLWKLIAYFEAFPLTWEIANAGVRQQAAEYINKVIDPAIQRAAFTFALGIPDLRSAALARVKALDTAGLIFVIANRPDPELKSIAIEKFGTAGTYRSAESLNEQLVLPFADILTSQQIETVLSFAAENSQIRCAARTPDHLLTLFNKSVGHRAATAPAWQKFRTALQSRGETWSGFSALDAAMTAAGI